MKKGAAGKKGAPPAPEPVPVVEETPKPTPEELEAIAKAEEAVRIRTANIARVTFPKLPIKQIVSYHSSTILAQETPIVVTLTDVKENEVRLAFRHKAGERGFIVESEVGEVVASLVHFLPEQHKYTSNLAAIQSLVRQFLPKHAGANQGEVPGLPSSSGAPSNHPPSTTDPIANLSTEENTPTNAPTEAQLTEIDFLQVFVQYFAPSFHFGQHLRLYAGRGCVSELRALLLRGTAINTANGEGLTALHIACEHNALAVVEALLSAQEADHPLLRLDLNVQDKYGWTPLHAAVHHGSGSCMQKLVSLQHPSASEYPGLTGVNVHLTTADGQTALHFACAQNRGALIAPLLAAGLSFSSVDHQGRTPLHLAAWKGHLSLFQEYATALEKKGKKKNNNSSTTSGSLEDGELNVSDIQDALHYLPKDYVNIDESPKIFV